MLRAVSRYGARVIPNTLQIIDACKCRGELLQGPMISEFEAAFARRHGGGQAISASYGRMALYYILRALDLPSGSEVIFPALTFWVIPEITRTAGLKPVFVDVDPATFNLDPVSFEKAITARTRAVVPTHLYGLACDMDPILSVARRYQLRVIEDCAHSLGATYRGRPVGTFGDAGFFSFQTLKPLNTYGGGMALVHDSALASRVASLAAAEPWPTAKQILRQLDIGRMQRILTRPRVFTWTAFPILWIASWIKIKPDVYLWESIRSLSPLPQEYRRRYTNVQAAIGLEGLRFLEKWTERTRAHAQVMDEHLKELAGVRVPLVPPGREHVYYQYCAYVPDRDELVRRCIQQGVDIETLHVDVCTRLAMFGPGLPDSPAADQAATAVQIPVYAGLDESEIKIIAKKVRQILAQQMDRMSMVIERT